MLRRTVGRSKGVLRQTVLAAVGGGLSSTFLMQRMQAEMREGGRVCSFYVPMGARSVEDNLKICRIEVQYPFIGNNRQDICIRRLF